MARKWTAFLRAMESFLKRLQLKAYRRVIIVFLLGILFAVGISPVLSQSPASPPIAQNWADAEKLQQEGTEDYQANRFNQAIEDWEQAAKIFEALGEKLKQAIILGNLSLTYQQLGKWEEAEKAIAKSLDLLGFNHDSKAPQTWQVPDVSTEKLKLLAPALDIYGRFWYGKGKPQRALYSWRTAAKSYQRLNNQERMLGSQINQVQALQALGLYRQAREIIEEVAKNLEKLSPRTRVKVQRSLGDVLRALGDLPNSRESLQDSLKVAESFNSLPDISAAHLSLGNTFRAWGNKERERKAPTKYEYVPWRCELNQLPAEAKQFYEKADEEYKVAINKSPDSATRIKAQLNRMSLLVETGKWQDAQQLAGAIELSDLPQSRTRIYAQINFAQSLACLPDPPDWDEIINGIETAIEDAQDLKDDRVKSYALGNLGGLYEYLAWSNQQEGQEKKAQQWRQKAQKLTQEALYLAQPSEAPDIAYQWQWQLGRLLKAQAEQAQAENRAAEAQEILERAIATYGEAYRTVKSLRDDLLYSEPERQFSFRDKVEPLYREYVSLLLSLNQEDDDQFQFIVLPEAAEKIPKAREVIDSLQLAELENLLGCKLLYRAGFKAVDRVVAAEEKTAAIYPIILEERLEVILKLPNQKQLERYRVRVSHDKVENTLKQLRYSLEQPYFSSKKGKTAAQEVYNWLIKPAEEKGLLEPDQIKTLVFVLDGSLRNIPMAALYDGEKYLVEKYAIAVALGNLELPDSQPTTQFKALIAGFSEKPQCENPECNQFGPLEYVKQEVDEINDVLQKRDVEAKVLYDDQFTSKALENEIKTAPYNIVHLATHGEFGFSRDSTFILTAPPESEDKLLRKKDNLKTPFSNQEKKIDANSEGKITYTNDTLYDFEDIKADLNELDNLLQVREQAPIELLVLSACETATGDNRQVLGIAGMAVQSGARTTLASLWSIDDSSTAELMREFYQELTKNEVTKAEALRLAQRQLLENPTKYKPSHWAPYILVGDWR